MGGDFGYVIKFNIDSTFTTIPNGKGLPPFNSSYTSGEQIVYAGNDTFGINVTNLEPGTEYYFKVFAYDTCSAMHQDSFIYAPTGALIGPVSTKSIPEIYFVDAVKDTIKKVYGDEKFKLNIDSDSPGTLSYEINGFPNGSIISLDSLILGNADTIIITVTQTETDSFVVGTDSVYIAIDKAMLTATADDLIKTKSDPDFDYSISYTGFKNDDDRSDIDQEPIVSSSATINSPPGQYTIILEGGIDNNYTFNLINGTITILDDPVIALRNDGQITSEFAPQGGLRYQRNFFLITPEEMAQSDLRVDSFFNSMGFTITKAQDSSTTAGLKIYLQNTTDTHARTNLTWNTTTVSSNDFNAVGLLSGEYEWQVNATCASAASEYTDIRTFSTVDTLACNKVNNITITSITDSSAVVNWHAPYSSEFSQYSIRYTESFPEQWISMSVTGNSYTLTNLNPDKQYQVRVRTECTSEVSGETGSSFATLNADVCNEPTTLEVSSITDTSAILSWDTSGLMGDRFEIEYRRIGSFNWLSKFASSDSVRISDLDTGVDYEWKVKTICSTGKGKFVNGANFITTGTPSTCFLPNRIFSNVVDDTSALLFWDEVPSAQSYNVRYRLKKSISWSDVIAPMSLVHDDSIKIPNRLGEYTIPFKGIGTSPLSYTGDGLYVAWEYTNLNGALSTFNSSLANSSDYNFKDQNGLDTTDFVLSLSSETSINSTHHENILIGKDSRPEIWLGTAGLIDEVEVAAVYAHGHHALSYQGVANISSLIKNKASVSKNYDVILEVKDVITGSVRYSSTQNVTINPNNDTIVKFTGWIPMIAELDSIIVSIPVQNNEAVTENNRAYYIQRVNRTIMSYDDASNASNAAGYGTEEGLILVRYKISGSGSVIGSEIYLDYSSIDHDLYAVILNEDGILLDSSNVFTPDSTEVNKYHTFYFPETPFFKDSTFYIGLAQEMNGVGGYLPVGVQWETKDIRNATYYRADLNGNNLVDHPNPGRLMIRAILAEGRTLPVIIGDPTLCEGSTSKLRVGNKITRYANQLIDVSSQFGNIDFDGKQALGPPDLFPEHSQSSNQWISSTADDQREFIILGFPNPSPINYIDIYETLNPGAIDSIYVKNQFGAFVPVYTGTAEVSDPVATRKHITFDTTLFDVSEIRISMASDSILGYNGIDAVAIGLESDTSDFVTYQWGGPVTSTLNAIDINAAGTYYVITTDQYGCESIDSLVVITPSQIRPELNIRGGNAKDTSFCDGESIVILSDRIEGNLWNTNEVTDSITVDTTGIYHLEFDDGLGCGLLYSDTIIVTVDSVPEPIISGSLGYCFGGKTTLTVNENYLLYNWSNDSTTQSIEVDTSDKFTVTVTDSRGCVGKSASVETFDTIGVTLSLISDLSVCPKDSIEIDAGSYSSYLWSSQENTQKIFIEAGETVGVTVTDNNGCIGTGEVKADEAPPLEFMVLGNSGFCPGDSTLLDAGEFETYKWSTGDTTRSVYAKSIDIFVVTVTDSGGCEGKSELTTFKHSSPSPTIEGEFVFCQEDSTILKVGDFTSYLWSTSETTDSIIVQSNSTYSVTVTDENGCTNSSIETTRHYKPTVPSIYGPDGFCPGKSITLQTDSIFSSFKWSNHSMANQTTISANGTYYVTVEDDNGCEGTNSKTIVENALPMPIIAGELGFCGGSNVLLKAVDNNGKGFVDYKWNNQLVSQSIIAETPGTYSVEVTDSNGCVNNTSVSVMEEGDVPSRPGTIIGPEEIGGGQYRFSLQMAVPEALYYVWYVPPGMTIVGENCEDEVIVSINGPISGEITVAAGNSCGLSPSVNPRTLRFSIP
jgi:hypothetical protein